MAQTSDHLRCIQEVEEIQNNNGNIIKVFHFDHQQLNDDTMSSWAKHFRNHYCSDEEIDFFIEGTSSQNKRDYLLDIKFPSTSKGLGPSIRAGDFGEILVADYLEYQMDYWVPRTRYDRKTIQDESTKGSDLTAFKMVSDNVSPDDILLIFEVKTGLSGKKYKNTLQKAVDHSVKDQVRKAESLNAIKQRLIDRRELDQARKVSRFQNFVDNPYKEESGAAALIANVHYNAQNIQKTNSEDHPNRTNLLLFTIYAQDFMDLVHKLYEKAAHEA